MKNSPSCGYSDPDPGFKCSLCARDISGLPSARVPRPGKG